MICVGKFEKVSFGQFYESIKRQFDWDDNVIKALYDSITLPTRATAGSAGYDFYAPIPIYLKPGESLKVPTGIRVKIDNGWWLACLPKSGLGFKYRLQLDNTVGVVDSDYYGSDNEGHIYIKITNDTHNDEVVAVATDSKFAQAIFLPYGVTYDDNADGIRNGGFGSTGK